MAYSVTVFRDREDAGQQLAERLVGYRLEDPIVLGLPRGGVIVAAEVARALRAPLDVSIARRLSAPGRPEFGIGAIAPGGVCVIDRPVVELLGLCQADVSQAICEETLEMARRLRRYRGSRPLPELRGRTVILVDDGLATGATARAAVMALRQLHPRHLVLAVPVCSQRAATPLLRQVDDFVCLSAPADFRAVGLWYQDFHEVADEEVIGCLEAVRQARAADAPAPDFAAAR
jgi:putative phosphoribosyl transferase